jgi:hypothetical protein
MSQGLPGNGKNDEPILTEGSPSLHTSSSLVCLNFKVPLSVRQQFKVYAARHNMTMTDLSLRLLDHCLFSDVTEARSNAITKQEIKK